MGLSLPRVAQSTAVDWRLQGPTFASPRELSGTGGTAGDATFDVVKTEQERTKHCREWASTSLQKDWLRHAVVVAGAGRKTGSGAHCTAIPARCAALGCLSGDVQLSHSLP